MRMAKKSFIIAFAAVFSLVIFVLMRSMWGQDQNENREVDGLAKTNPLLTSRLPVDEGSSGPDIFAFDIPVGDAGPSDPASQVILQRLEANLPPRPPLRSALQDLLRDKTTPELVGMLGHPLFIIGEGSGIPLSLHDIEYLTYSMANNLVVLELVERGRKSPGQVSDLIMHEFVNDVEEWDASVEDRYQKILRGELSSAKGFLMSFDGEVQGDDEELRRWEIGYRIPASLFILANVESAETENAAVLLLSACSRHTFTKKYSPMDEDMAYFAIASARSRERLWGESGFVVSTEVSRSNAVMSSSDPANHVVDGSIEPMLDLILPEPRTLKALSLLERIQYSSSIQFENYVVR